ncbi:DUF1292 domain-containing protein [Sedimentibacter sp. zth1]|uniref:DUF1292 domain-containing protein n=1 Tax=Sedimentibacter sp. zth1 TaxID=2816908 RepID=UPI001A9221FD|nr:DUF1292 domain-containing protein [Sedimentibacter sp. zth1]QSX06437.1 DUF1292 domain-containing protein [Sedimentibacter sp. zth1]
MSNKKKFNNDIIENELEEDEDDYEEQVVELINDAGKVERLIVEATFHLDNIKYAVLREENSDEGMIYSIDELQNGEVMFNMIEDEEELKEVIEIYEAMADDII